KPPRGLADAGAPIISGQRHRQPRTTLPDPGTAFTGEQHYHRACPGGAPPPRPASTARGALRAVLGPWSPRSWWRGDGARKRIGRAYGLRKRRATETFQPAYGGV